jgi:hypothetical protein
MNWTWNSGLGQWMTSITAEQWTAAGTWATVLVALVAAMFVLGQVGEARRLRVGQAQPYVVALMEQNPTAPAVIEVAFRNYGMTAARNIEIASDPKLRCTDGSGGVQAVWVPGRIPMLAPGQEWRTFWDDAQERPKCDELRNEDAHRIVITYDGVEGTGRQTTTSVLDWAAHRGRLFVHAKTLDDAASALGDISTTIKEWSETHGGLAVFTRDGAAKDERDAERAADRLRVFAARRAEREAYLQQLAPKPEPETGQ